MHLARALAADRTRLARENLALRQQLAVYQRSAKRPRLNDGDRMFWTMACEFLENWREHLVIGKPDTATASATSGVGSPERSRAGRRSRRRSST